MATMLFAFLPLLAAQPTVGLPEPRLVMIEVAIYQGNPAGNDRQVITRPMLVTRDREQAMVSVGQCVQLKEVGTQREEANQNESFETGCVILMTTARQADGRISVRAAVTLKELVCNTDQTTQTRENKTQFHTVCKPGETVTLPLYNINDYQDVVASKDLAGVITQRLVKKPFTGRECWVEFVVRGLDPTKDLHAEQGAGR